MNQAVQGRAVYAVADGGSAGSGAAMLKVAKTAEFTAAPAQIWAVIEQFADLTWIPPVKASSATNGNTLGSLRTLDLGGPTLVEELTAYDAGAMTYTYIITDDPANVKTMPVTEYTSVIAVQPSGAGSLVTWTGTFRRGDPSATPAPGLDDETALGAIAGVYEAGFAGLRAKLGG